MYEQVVETRRNPIEKSHPENGPFLVIFYTFNQIFPNSWKKCTVEWKKFVQVINSPIVTNP